VQAKRLAAYEWYAAVNACLPEWALPWTYLLLPHNAAFEDAALEGLESRFAHLQ
jgi:hypothetical protein